MKVVIVGNEIKFKEGKNKAKEYLSLFDNLYKSCNRQIKEIICWYPGQMVSVLEEFCQKEKILLTKVPFEKAKELQYKSIFPVAQSRNKSIIEKLKPDLVVVLPGKSWCNHMVMTAKKHRIEVWDIRKAS